MTDDLKQKTAARLTHRHLLGIEGLSVLEMRSLLHRSVYFADVITGQRHDPGLESLLKGRAVVNLFFENSTRTRVSFEVAAKRLGASVLNISVSGSSVKKGETLIDTATTLNAMKPDILVIRHQNAGAPTLLSHYVDGCVINAGDGRHEHPTQALLDALTILRRFGRIEGLKIAICGDIANSRVARSNLYLLGAMGAELRFGNCRFGNFIKNNSLIRDITCFTILFQQFTDMPANGLSFPVGISCEDQPIGSV